MEMTSQMKHIVKANLLIIGFLQMKIYNANDVCKDTDTRNAHTL